MPSADAPQISVVLPTYNRADRLLDSVNSVLRQSFTDLELIVVDDASTDSTLEVLREISDPRLRVIELSRNGGANRARNAGVNAARGRLIAFQDSDDQWRNQKLEKQVNALEKSGADVVFCSLNRKNASSVQSVPKPSHRVPEGLLDVLPKLLRGNFISNQTLLIRSECLSDNKFDEQLQRLQDWELCLRLAQQFRFYFLPDVLVDVCTAESNRISKGHESYSTAVSYIIGKHRKLFALDRTALAIAHLNAAIKSASARDGSRLRAHVKHAFMDSGFSICSALAILVRRAVSDSLRFINP